MPTLEQNPASPGRLSRAHGEVEADRLTNRGVDLMTQSRRDEALLLFRQAVLACPSFAKAQHNLGVALAEQGKTEDALKCLREAVRLQPDYADAHYNLGNVLGLLQKPDESIAAYRNALRCRPDYAQSMNNLGLALTMQGRPGEGLILLKQALRLRPELSEALNNLGLALTELGKFNDAEGYFDRALDLNPQNAEAHNNLGNLYKEKASPEEALACYDLALTLQPGAVSTHWNRALVLLQEGDYERGWPEYEWRLRKPDSGIRPFACPLWDGRDFPGEVILLHMEQGLGDMLQFIRYAPLVKARGGHVAVTCPSGLRTLFASVLGVDQVIDERDELPAFQYHAPLLSLPAILGTSLTTLPGTVPYLRALPTDVDHWRDRLSHLSALKVGICWQGNPRHRRDRQRSLPLRQLEPLAGVPGIQLISLQCGFGTEQIAALRDRFSVLEWIGAMPSWAETAGLAQNLDLVITVDTSIAHLGGALGIPTWVALPTSPDWRWLRDRDDSPWYPATRLFRQVRRGDWRPVIEKMRRELCKVARKTLPEKVR